MQYKTRIIRTVQEWKDFLDLPFALYRNDAAWVPPLRSETTKVLNAKKNPYFRDVALEKFVCYREGQPVARAIAVVNPKHWEKFGQKTAFFGFFESINEELAVQSLFDAIETYCAEKGAEYLEGPFNPNHYSELGLLVENFSAPVFFETYNPDYYATLLTAAGFEPTVRLHTRVIRDTTQLAAAGMQTEIVTRARQAGYTIRPFRLFHMRSELERIREVYNDAFEDNWHFLPLSREEYIFSAQSMFLVTNPGLVQIVEYHGQPVGVLQFVLNVNPVLAQMNGRMSSDGLLHFIRQRFAIREIVLYAGGIKKAYRKTPAIDLFVWALSKLAGRYRVVYGTWMLDSNTAAVKAAERVGFVPYKWFAIFGKRVKSTI